MPHTVQPGETLWSIAAANNLTTRTVAAVNGISPDAHVVIGSTIQVPTVSEGAAALGGAAPGGLDVDRRHQRRPAPHGPSTGGTVGPSGVGSIASQHGVPPSLAAAIAHQESGFNNSMVSSAGARGVMQVMPSTFDYVDHVLGAGPHDPSSPSAEHHGRRPLPAPAPARVRRRPERGRGRRTTRGRRRSGRTGLLPDTQQYVANVMALKARYGG